MNSLPPNVNVSDTKWPSYTSKDRVIATLNFYNVTRLGWVLQTLHIAKSRRPEHADRTYAVQLNGSICRVGKGPHVLATVTVYVRKSRKAALQKYLDLHETGLAAAGMVRDRISSRRAEGQLRRARGERSWLWSN